MNNDKQERRLNAKIIGGYVSLYIDDIVASLSDEDKATLMKSAAVEQEVLTAIVGLICNDITQDGWWSGGNWLPKLRLLLSERLGGAETEALRYWMNEAVFSQQVADEYRDDYFRLERAYGAVRSRLYEATNEPYNNPDAARPNIGCSALMHISTGDVAAVLEFMKTRRAASEKKQ
jgi:hypothetical protein